MIKTMLPDNIVTWATLKDPPRYYIRFGTAVVYRFALKRKTCYLLRWSAENLELTFIRTTKKPADVSLQPCGRVRNDWRKQSLQCQLRRALWYAFGLDGGVIPHNGARLPIKKLYGGNFIITLEEPFKEPLEEPL